MGHYQVPPKIFKKLLLDLGFIEIEIPEDVTGNKTLHLVFLTEPAQIKSTGVDVIEHGILLEIPFRGAAFMNEDIDASGFLKKRWMDRSIAGIQKAFFLSCQTKMESQR